MLRRLGSSLLVALVCSLTAGCHPLGPDRIPPALPEGRVADLAGLLSAAEVAQLQRLADAVHAKDGAELVVLTLGTTAGIDPRKLATSVFNSWKLGDPVRNNGLLILVAPGDRAAEIVLGKGIDSDFEVAITDRIMQDEMLPHLRDGRHAEAILAGAQACAAKFFGVAALPAEAMPGPPRPLPPRPWRRPRLEVVIPFGLVALAVLGYLLSLAFRQWERRRPRRCGSCGQRMARLSEAEEDRHLTPGQQAEELAGSYDHDVWACLGCGNVETRANQLISPYFRCRKCHNATARRFQKVLRPATNAENGQVQIASRCGHCDHTEITTHDVFPSSFYSGRATRDTSRALYEPERDRSPERPSRRRDSSSSGGGSSSSGGGSSSSGGGGGGKSDGRGSSGRW